MEYNFLIENIIRFYKSGYAVPTFWIIFLAVYLSMLFAPWDKNKQGMIQNGTHITVIFLLSFLSGKALMPICRNK